jgi:hypothetical protein
LGFLCSNLSGLKNLAHGQLSNAFGKKRAASVLLLGLFLFVLAMAQFESFHNTIHSDSRQPDHQCAATILRGGQLDAPPPGEVGAAVSPVALVADFVQPPAIVVSFEFALLPSCGPPALLF